MRHDCDCDLSRFRPVAETPRGARFDAGHGIVVVVTRRSNVHKWVDIDVGPGTWTKRILHGIPTAWAEVTP